MSITLAKGQTLSLSKENSGLKKVFMGLGWDPVEKKSGGGFLSRMLGGGGGETEIDLDASVIVLDAAKNTLDTVSFSKLTSKDGAIRHGGDNLTGAGDGDDEVIYVDLEALNPQAAHLIFTVNSFRGQTFDEVENAFARLVDDSNQREICKYVLSEKGAHTGVIMASLSKTSEGWKMTAHGAPGTGRTVSDMAKTAIALV